MAQVAGRKAARVGGRALDSALLDGVHAHAILGVPSPARAAGLRAHSTTKPLLSIVAEYTTFHVLSTIVPHSTIVHLYCPQRLRRALLVLLLLVLVFMLAIVVILSFEGYRRGNYSGNGLGAASQRRQQRRALTHQQLHALVSQNRVQNWLDGNEN